MSDLVEWLRASQAERDQVILVDASLLWRAADEIERLRMAVAIVMTDREGDIDFIRLQVRALVEANDD